MRGQARCGGTRQGAAMWALRRPGSCLDFSGTSHPAPWPGENEVFIDDGGSMRDP